MNYYARYPGDYVMKTLDMSMIEDGAYTRLLDWYYSNERAIQHAKRYEVARATTPAAKAAVDAVLASFFKRDAEVWRHERADEEIAKAAPRIEAAKANGAKGGRRPKGNPKENPAGSPKTNPPGNPAGTQPASSPTLTPENTEPSTPAGGSAREAPDLEVAGHQPTAYGAITRRLMQAGISRVNPGHLRFRALVDAGATAEEFLAYTDKAANAGDPFAYLIGAVEGERKRLAANSGKLHLGALPARAKTFRETDEENAKQRVREMTGGLMNGEADDADTIDMEVPRGSAIATR